MASVALLKPGSVPDLINTTAEGGITPTIHNASGTGDNNERLLIKVQRATVRVGTQVIETTGSGDTHSKFEHNLQGSGSAMLSGFVLADSALIGLHGIYHSGDNTANPYGVVLRMGTVGANTRVLAFKLVVQNVDITYIKNQPVIGMTIQGVMTEFTNSGARIINEVNV